MFSTLRDKVVVITGASSGIGEATAYDLAKKGARLVLLARRMDRLTAVVAQTQAFGAQAVAFECDVNKRTALDSAIEKTVEKFGGVDVLIANAGFGVTGKFEDLTAEDYQRQLQTNVIGVVHSIHAALPYLKKSNGRIAIVGSILSYFSLTGQGAYAMSKYAVRALAESLYHELRPAGVSVTLVCPGLIQSEFRRVDNKGVFHAEGDTHFTPLHMPAHTAAAQMVRAIERRKKGVITWHGKILVWIARFAPWIFSLLLRLGLSGRKPMDV